MNLPTTILDALNSHAQDRGNDTAYTFLGSNDQRTSITYRELDLRARNIAHVLLQQAEPGDRALMMYPAGLDFIEAFLGCLYAGIVAVPAYPPRKNRNAERVLSIAADCTPRLLLCTSETQRNVNGVFAESVTGATVVVTDESEATETGSLPELRSGQLAFLQYTSGSTATPKGVMVTHGNIVANEIAIMTNFEHTRNDVAVSWLPMFHDMGLIGGVLQPLFVGFPCYLMAPGTFIQEPYSWLKAISDYRGVMCGAPNFAYDLCVRKVTDEQKQHLDLRSWIAFNGSEPVRADTLNRFSASFESCGFRKDAFFPCYGMAETTLFVSGGPPLAAKSVVTAESFELEQHRIVDSREGQQLVSCGQVGPDLEVCIVRPETCEPCQPDEVGEVWVHGASVAKGYWNRPDDTQQSFRATLRGNPRKWFRTGDYGFLRDGELYVAGRLKDLIILRGRNIYPQDIENVVERHFDFLEPNSCAAFSVDDNGQEKLVVVAEGTREMVRWGKTDDQTSCDRAVFSQVIEDLRAAILNEFEISLTDLVFVRPTSFPRTSSGKVQRRLAKRMWLQGEFHIVLESSTSRHAPVLPQPVPCDDMVRVICQTLREWGTDEEKTLPVLEPTTAFSSLGIDSMSAADVGLRLEKKTGVRVDGETLYQQRTIHELADYLIRRRPSNPLSGINRTPQFTKADFLSSLEDGLLRFRSFREAGHDYFATEIERQEGCHVWVGGRRMLMMASYSYLGLINCPEVNEAAQQAIADYGTGAHGVRLLAGTFDAHRRLERQIAEFVSAEDAIVYSSGFMTNLATIAALAGEGDVVIGDELNHASIVDGCRFSNASFLTFSHNDTQQLEMLLKQHTGRKILVVVDAVYSMDGDIAPLPTISELCHRYGALLMVDEAHSLGVIGDTGKGIQEHFGLPDDAIDIKMGTLSKAIASCGGFIAARQEIVDYLKHNARGFIFSAALPAAQVGAARKCLEIIQRESQAANRIRQLRSRLVAGLTELGFDVSPSESAIVPVIFSTEEETLQAVGFCRAHGLFVVPVFYPAVPMDQPRIRATVMATMTDEDIEEALMVFHELAIHRSEKKQLAETGRPGSVEC